MWKSIIEMKLIPIIIIVVIMTFSVVVHAQEVSFRTEYIGNSSYYYLPPGEKPKEKIGEAKGSAVIYEGSLNIPFSNTLDGNNHPLVWGAVLGGSYTDLTNENFENPMVSQILNLQLGFYHLRHLNEKWSIRASLGMGLFMPSTDFSKASFKNILFSGGVIFIRQLNPDLHIGGGVAVNSSLGYPMLFPAFYVKWKLRGRFDVNIEMTDGLDASIAYDFNNKFILAYAMEIKGQVALLKRQDKDMIFSHQYIVTGFRPEYKIGTSGLSLMGMAGLNLYRPASFSERSIKGIFSSDNDYYFSVSPYISAGIRMKF